MWNRADPSTGGGFPAAAARAAPTAREGAAASQTEASNWQAIYERLSSSRQLNGAIEEAQTLKLACYAGGRRRKSDWNCRERRS